MMNMKTVPSPQHTMYRHLFIQDGKGPDQRPVSVMHLLDANENTLSRVNIKAYHYANLGDIYQNKYDRLLEDNRGNSKDAMHCYDLKQKYYKVSSRLFSWCHLYHTMHNSLKWYYRGEV